MNELPKYISYIRVSTKNQEISGLGIGAQRETVGRYVANKNGIILSEYVEIESGTKKGIEKRVKLRAALEECKAAGAILILAKLDRLARDTRFMLTILDENVEIVFCDFPDASRLTLTIFAALAEYEAKLISERTKAALAEKKRQGARLGNPHIKTLYIHSIEARKKAGVAAKLNTPNSKISSLIIKLRQTGHSHVEIAEILNEAKLTTTRGRAFTGSNVSNIYERNVPAPTKNGFISRKMDVGAVRYRP